VEVSAPGILSFDRRTCIGCGHCAAFCPEDAWELGEPGWSGGLEGLLQRRRTARIFGPLLPGDLDELLEVAGLSPTGTNACGLVVEIVEGSGVAVLAGRIRRLTDPLRRCGLLGLAGAVSGYGRWLGRLAAGEDLVFRGAPAVLFFDVPRRNPTRREDAVIAATIVMLKAEEMGLATMWNGIALRLGPLLGRPGRGLARVAVLCAGRRVLEPRRLPPRDYRIVRRP
jgi:nitroreductase